MIAQQNEGMPVPMPMMMVEEEEEGKMVGGSVVAEEKARLMLQSRECLSRLNYRIHSSSGYSADYSPENILIDSPTDQSSRWSSPSNDHAQFLMLELPQPAIISTITFGKFHKVHVCNLREFRVLVGTEEGSLRPVLHSGLRNDADPETFCLVGLSEPLVPVRYVKIVPLAAHGSSFNYSIWYVELRGIQDGAICAPLSAKWREKVEERAWRVALQFIRDRGFREVFEKLEGAVGCRLEDGLLGGLHRLIVEEGRLGEAERMVGGEEGKAQLAEHAAADLPQEVVWERIDPPSPRPGKRGGHQMAYDPVTDTIWLLGGWDGERELGDLWSFSVAERTWRCVSEDTARQGGPGPRSCHKIVLDAHRRQLFVLGRFVEVDRRATEPLCSDLHVYHVDLDRWSCLSEDTAAEGGPALLYDLQMCVDEREGRVWVFGGKVVLPPLPATQHQPVGPNYSGLYCYDIAERRWSLVREDDSGPAASPSLRSRIGHCLVWDEAERLMHILQGQRMKDYLSDYYVYRPDTDTVITTIKDVSAMGGPSPGFTQRACLHGHGNIIMFSGLIRDRQPGGSLEGASSTSGGSQGSLDSTQNTLWSFDVRRGRWTCLYRNANQDARYWEGMREREPCPRYAHQLVAAGSTGELFLFAGNPGDLSNPRTRLDDLWSIRLLPQHNPATILQHVTFLIRKQRFKEMCQQAATSPPGPQKQQLTVAALQFLQNDVADTVTPADQKDFQSLSASLFQPARPSEEVRGERLALYEQIVQCFPRSARPPPVKLVELLAAEQSEF